MQKALAKRTVWVRLAALTCFFVLLSASFAGTIHKHVSAQDTTCLICHASDETADTVAIASEAGRCNFRLRADWNSHGTPVAVRCAPACSLAPGSSPVNILRFR